MTLQEYADSLSRYDAKRLQNHLIDLTMKRHDMHASSEQYEVISLQIEIVREELLERKHAIIREREW